MVDLAVEDPLVGANGLGDAAAAQLDLKGDVGASQGGPLDGCLL